MKKISIVLICLLLIFNNTLIAFADEIPTPAVLDQDSTTFNVIVPTTLPVNVDKNGDITIAGHAEIINNSYGPVIINAFKVSPKNGWSLVNFSENLRKGHKFGENKFSVKLCNTQIPDTGTVNLSPGISIPGEGKIPFSYQFKVSPIAIATNESIADVIIVMDWDKTDNEVNPPTPKPTPVSDWEYTIVDGKAIVSNYKGTSTNLVFPATIEGKPVVIDDNEFQFSSRNDITSIDFEEGVIFKDNDASFAFSDNTNLISINNLPSTLTNIESIAKGCKKLKNIPEIPSSITKMNGAFSGCYNIPLMVNITIPKSVSDISFLFEYASGLYGTINIEGEIIDASSAFKGTSQTFTINTSVKNKDILEEAKKEAAYSEGITINYTDVVEEPEITEWEYIEETDNIVLTKYIGKAVDVVVPAILRGKQVILGDTSVNAETHEISGVFAENTSIETVSFEDSIQLPVDGLDRMFLKCIALKEVYNLPNTTSMNGTFVGCISLEKFPIIPNGVVSMNSTFSKCSSIVGSITIPESVEIIDRVFYSCTNKIENVYILSENITSAKSPFNGMRYKCDGEVIIHIKESVKDFFHNLDVRDCNYNYVID